MIFDLDFVYGGLVMAMVNLVTVAAIGTAVARVLIRQRSRENAFRVRIARWRQLTESPAE